jgi:hypothetical protein
MHVDVKDEEAYVMSMLRLPLVNIDLMLGITHRRANRMPDFLTWKRDVDVNEWVLDAIRLVSEVKSRHNLPLPMTANSVSELYNQAYQGTIVSREGRTDAWSHVCHPIGQIFSYMVEKGRRYGALTCGARTYFIRIAGSSRTANVQISDSWFVGEAGYIRAWLYVHNLGKDQNDPWQKTRISVQLPQRRERR